MLPQTDLGTLGNVVALVKHTSAGALVSTPSDAPHLPAYDGPVVDIVITYNPAEFEDQALQLARRLFAELDLQIGTLTLAPVDELDFAVWIDGCLVASYRAGDMPTSAICVAVARERLATRES